VYLPPTTSPGHDGVRHRPCPGAVGDQTRPPTEEGYAALVKSIKQFCNTMVHGARAAATEAAATNVPKPKSATRPKPVRREDWVADFDQVAKWQLHPGNYQGPGRAFPP
jgi:hypothetical protein